MTAAKETVLVTGANGFLGQFIIKLLQERDDEVGEIRALDWTGFTKRIDYPERVPVEVVVGDVRVMSALLKAFQNVDCVIHTAALIDISSDPDTERMRQVNTEGTRNVINACLQQGVKRLVFTSTVDVVVGTTEFPHVRENQAPIPRRFLMADYPETKYAAEELVLKADHTPLANDAGVLRTLALRPVVTYGEGDPYFVVNSLRSAAKRGGTLLRIHRRLALLQPAYVGNVAWAHLVAKDALKRNSDHVSGMPYFINDDTLPCNAFDFVEPFLEARGLRVSTNGIPYWLLYLLLVLAHWVLSLVKVVYEPAVKLPSLGQVQYVCKTFVVSRMRATSRLRYSPIYRPEEAMSRSLQYYKNLPL